MNVNSTMSYAEWLELADEYYLSARSLQWFTGLFYPTTLAGHHALELYFKAICVNKSGRYDNQQHDLRKLYEAAKRLEPLTKNKAVEFAVDKYWNYDQLARYSSKESNPRKKPINNAMGTDNLRALDIAVGVLRDLSVETRRGIDRLIEGETDITKALSIRDAYLSLQSVILFHNNDVFKPKKPEIMSEVNFSAPLWRISES